MTDTERRYKESEKALKAMCTAYRFKKYGDVISTQDLERLAGHTLSFLRDWIKEQQA